MYMLQEIDILEDWTAIKKVRPPASFRPCFSDACFGLAGLPHAGSLRAWSSARPAARPAFSPGPLALLPVHRPPFA